ncbi:filamentous hemagglutinin N-terminal domain-containing protein [Paraburkholderia sp. RAU2J]|uniref:two-partner secretion domain-containing protein n=1 Tax=Paraburkholderia sp. RAU2J TaxID=1938810 RepID=UPI000EAB8495|nr:filamentous hemagglutinin N-terminal domain-containing protein [Paraburkholderia sp. RAU2J]
MALLSSGRPVLRVLRRRQPSQHVAPLIAVLLAGLSLPHAASASGVLPKGGHYVAGTGTIASQCDALTVTQPGSTRGVIDWTSFSIGRGNTVTFNNGSGATLNRVTASGPSALLGSLNATGSVYLINPQGIVVGRSGVISTGGRFVASTLDLPDTAFMNGGTLTLSGTSNGKVVNLGKISSSGGDVFLIARDVVLNDGVVSAPNGTAEYVVGKEVLLSDSPSARQLFVQTGNTGTVIDRGTTLAAQLNLEAADGNIYALAGGGSRIRATGTATRYGHIWLVADKGHVTQQGTVAATNVDGSGGTVDTLAAALTFGHDAAVQAGLWNVSTPGFIVDRTTARAFMRSLNNGTSVYASATGTDGASGDMSVLSNLDWNGSASLSLVAFRHVAIGPQTTIRNTGSGNLSLRADASGIDNQGSVANEGVIDWSGSKGLVSTYFDMNGGNRPGVVMTNPDWVASAFGGPVSQYTPYKLANSLADLDNINLDLSGNYALGKDLNAAPPAGTFNAPIGGVSSNALTYSYFNGQFDGLGHTISNLSFNAAFSDFAPPGGLFSVIGTTGIVRDLNVQGTITGPATLGAFGILAGSNLGIVASVHSSGVIDLPLAGISVHAGGLIGDSRGLTYRSSSSTDISTLSAYTGGLIGADTGNIRQSFATGNVAANGGTAGGLVGQADGLVSQSYATGSVTAQQGPVGALVGENLGYIEQSFATGHLHAPDSGGGIAAVNTDFNFVASDVFWDTQTTGTTIPVVSVVNNGTVGHARGLTTAQMAMPSSFAGYDFGPNGVWVMPAGATHPLLRWQLGP